MMTAYSPFYTQKEVYLLVLAKDVLHQPPTYQLLMKTLLTLALLLLCMFTSLVAQVSPPAFNLDFEEVANGQALPDQWMQWGSYPLRVDTLSPQSGTRSLLISAPDAGGAFGSIAYRIQPQYAGEKITLEGYMKTENVAEGHAGLLLRIDGEGGPLHFDNMQGQGIKGTNPWKKYTITLPLPAEATQIFVAGILVGKGKAWYDNFRVLIDGKDIRGLQPTERERPKAELDNEFDDGSTFSLDAPTPAHLERLFWLGKVWGFLKYHHPKIAQGEVNWDYELFRILPSIKEAGFDQALLNWAQQLGEVEAASMPQNNEEIKIHPSTDWIQEQGPLSAALVQYLKEVQATSRESKSYYLSFVPNIGNPQFKNEKAYTDIPATDDGFRLLGLFRFWNMIEYFFPYKHLMDENWDTVLRSSLPSFLKAEAPLAYKLATLQLISKIQDTHANIWMQDEDLNAFHGNNIAPIEVNIIEGQAVVVRAFPQLAENSKITTGDIITHINGRSTQELIEEKIAYCPASNRATQLRDVARRLLRTNEDGIELSISGQKTDYKEEVSCVPVQDINFWKKDIPSHRALEGEIGYIYPASLKKGEIHDIMKKFMDKKGIVVDLRCYPSDFIVFSLGGYLMPRPTEFVKFTFGNLQQPGQFAMGSPISVGGENASYFKGKVAILINETTQSQAEYTTMALRVAPKTQVIGSTTAAADGNVSQIILPGGIRTMISGIGVYYPDGTETQRVGILPDVELRPSIKGIRMGKDELLEKAIEWIDLNE